MMFDEKRNMDRILRESEAIQIKLASEVLQKDVPFFDGEQVTGIDVAYRDNRAFACAVVMDIATQSVIRTESLVMDCEFPYIPGHFYLREAPAIINLLGQIKDTGPILIDGNGILHPRRFGLASHIGVKLNRQTIGVAKRLHIGEIDERIDNLAVINESDEPIGVALWIRKRKKPLYISVGHRISMDTAIRVVTSASFKDDPEPLHQAHICSVRLREESI